MAQDVAEYAEMPSQMSAEQAGPSVESGVGWALDRIDQRDRALDGKYYYWGDGTGVHAYVIDSVSIRIFKLGRFIQSSVDLTARPDYDQTPGKG